MRRLRIIWGGMRGAKCNCLRAHRWKVWGPQPAFLNLCFLPQPPLPWCPCSPLPPVHFMIQIHPSFPSIVHPRLYPARWDSLESDLSPVSPVALAAPEGGTPPAPFPRRQVPGA